MSDLQFLGFCILLGSWAIAAAISSLAKAIRQQEPLDWGVKQSLSSIATILSQMRDGLTPLNE